MLTVDTERVTDHGPQTDELTDTPTRTYTQIYLTELWKKIYSACHVRYICWQPVTRQPGLGREGISRSNNFKLDSVPAGKKRKHSLHTYDTNELIQMDLTAIIYIPSTIHFLDQPIPAAARKQIPAKAVTYSDHRREVNRS